MSGYITFEERLEIESMIFQRCSFGEIAKKIKKDRSTISREIRRHSVIEKAFFAPNFIRTIMFMRSGLS